MSCVTNGSLSATYNFRVTAHFIPSKANSVADAIPRLRDPVLSHALSDLFSGIRVSNDSCEAHFSQPAFSLPRQVQSMLKNSNFKKNCDSTIPMPLHNPQRPHTSHNYERNFAFASSLATRRFPAALYTSFDT